MRSYLLLWILLGVAAGLLGDDAVRTQVELTPDEVKAVERFRYEEKQKNRKPIWAEFSADCMDLILHGSKEDLKAFHAMSMKLLKKDLDVPKNMKMMAEDYEAIDSGKGVTIPLDRNKWFESDTTENIQKCIDAWPGEFWISNPMPRSKCKPTPVE